MPDNREQALQPRVLKALRGISLWGHQQVDTNFEMFGAHSGHLSKREHFYDDALREVDALLREYDGG